MFFKNSKKVNDELQQELQKLREENEKLKMCIVDWKDICRDSRIRMDELLLENQKLLEENKKLKEEQKIILKDRSLFLEKWIQDFKHSLLSEISEIDMAQVLDMARSGSV